MSSFVIVLAMSNLNYFAFSSKRISDHIVVASAGEEALALALALARVKQIQTKLLDVRSGVGRGFLACL